MKNSLLLILILFLGHLSMAITVDITPSVLGGSHSGEATLSEVYTADGLGMPNFSGIPDAWMDIDKGEVMHLTDFDVNCRNGVISAITLEVQFSVEAGYGGSNAITYNFLNTGIVPTNSGNNQTGSFDLYSAGITTWAQVNALNIEFTSDDNAGADAVAFDHIVVRVTYTDVNPPPGTYDVGPSGYFASITDALVAIKCMEPITGPYVLELQQTYNSVVETFPLSVYAIDGMSSDRTITIQPEAGASGLSIESAQVGTVVDVNEGDFYIFDGRPGGVGGIATTNLKVINTKTSAGRGSVFQLSNDASNNLLSFLNIEGEVEGTGNGLIYVSETTNSTGNDDNTVESCVLSDLTVGGSAFGPYCGVFSNGTAGKTNDNLLINNCHFDNVQEGSIASSAGVRTFTNTPGITITNNHFYKSIAYTAGLDNLGAAIIIESDGGHLIEGNFIGGSGSSCSGMMMINGGTAEYTGIVLNNSTSGNNSIINNKFAGITFITECNTTFYPLQFVFVDGTSTVQIEGNLIGENSGIGSLILTHNGTNSKGFNMIENYGSATLNVINNNCGAITQNGTRDLAITKLIDCLNGAMTIESNTFGNATANNIVMSSNSGLYGISNTSSSGIVANNNVFQNWDYNATSAYLYGISSAGGYLSADGNTFTDINSASDGIGYFIHNNASNGASITNNTIQKINLSNGGATVQFRGISNSGVGGDLDASQNKIQNISINSSANNSTKLYGIYSSSSGNSYVGFNELINLENTYTGANNSLISAIEVNNVSSSGVIEGNYVTDVKNGSNGPSGPYSIGIHLANGSWDIVNNVVLIDNLPNTNGVEIYGIAESSSGTSKIQHNTVRIGGNASNSSVASSAYIRNGSGNSTVLNNVFQNARTLALNGNFAIHTTNTGTYTFDYNYLEVTENPGRLSHINGVDHSFASWPAAVGGATNSLNGTTVFDANGYTSVAFVGASMGSDLTATVPLDKDGIARSTTPWMGAYEGTIKDKDSRLAIGAGIEPTSISSIIDSDGEEIMVMDFELQDLGTSDGLASILNQLTIYQSTDNAIADWTTVIGGAKLYGPDLASGLSATITSTSIEFTSLGMISVADGTNETYELRIYLKTDLSGISDNDRLGFQLDFEDIASDPTGSTFNLGVVETGAGKVAVDIIASELRYSASEPPTTAYVNNIFYATVIATDENGNIDTDFAGDISISLNTGAGSLVSGEGFTLTAANGEVNYTQLTHNTAETITLLASNGGLTNVVSDNILVSSATVITVGDGTRDFFTIQAAYNAIPDPITDNYFIELYADYDPNNEAWPITFDQKSGHSASNLITIRPALGQTNIAIEGDAGNGVKLIDFDGGDYIVIDGRPGGVGTDNELTTRNTRTTATARGVFNFQNDASNNTLKYLNIESETSTGSSIISISLSTVATGNDDNTIENCVISDLTIGGTAARPKFGVLGIGSDGRSNDNLIIRNCEFIDIYGADGENAGVIDAFSNCSGWQILDNHFYQTSAYDDCNFSYAFIFVEAGGGYLISGNYLGGTEAFCGGSKFDISSGGGNLNGITFTSGASGADNYVESNVIENLSFTYTGVNPLYPLLLFVTEGTSNFYIGGAGKGNRIGNPDQIDDVVLTNSGATGSFGFYGIALASTGNTYVQENEIYNMRLDGATTDANSVIIANLDGTTTISGNIVDGVNIASDAALTVIEHSSASAISILNNTIENIDHQATTNALSVILTNGGSPTIDGNHMYNISTASSATSRVILELGSDGAIIQNNVMEKLNWSDANATFHGIYINTTGDVVTTNNSIGTETAEITIAGNKSSTGIFKAGTGNLDCFDNVIENINLTSNGAATAFSGIEGSNGLTTIENNLIQNITSATNNTVSSLIGIELSSGLNGHSIKNNRIENLVISETGTITTDLNGIYCAIGSGDGTMENNFVTGLKSDADGGDIAAYKIWAGNWDVFNNVAIIENEDRTNDTRIYGIYDISSSNIYHNTIKIAGTNTGSMGSIGLHLNATGVVDVLNNIFQNLRTGGSGLHRAVNVADITSKTIDFNYIEVDPSQSGNIGNWNGTDYDFGNWQGVSGALSDISATQSIDAEGYPLGSAMESAGTNLTGIVPLDKDGLTRSTFPWLGAYESGESFAITTDLLNAQYCGGENTSITYTIDGTFGAGNVFTAEISDENGDFSSPLTIGSVISTINADISAIIPTSANGTGYRIRVNSSNPALTGTDNGQDITINSPSGVTAGYDQSTCATSTSMLAEVASVGTSTWSVVSGTASISSPNDNLSSITGLAAAPASATLRWTTTFGSCSHTDDVVIQSITGTGTDGELDLCFNSLDGGGGNGANNKVITMVEQPDGKILIGGQFTEYGGVARSRIARLNANGSLDENFDPGTGLDFGSVQSILVQPDGKIIIGGFFTNYNGTGRGYIARLNENGSIDATFNPPSGANSGIYAMALQDDGKIVIGGAFTSYDGTGRNYVARVNSDGTLDAGFNPGTGATISVNAMDIQSDGKIIIGGGFTTYNGTGINRIARINTDGTLDGSFDPGTGVNQTIREVIVQDDDKIMLAGDFTTYNGNARSYIARANADGTIDATFNPGTGANSSIEGIDIQDDGKVVIVGFFSTYNGTGRTRIARVNSDGTIDATFNPGTGANTAPSDATVLKSGKILIGGNFLTLDGNTKYRIGRLNSDGSVDDTFDQRNGANNSVNDICLQPDDKMIVVGNFTTYNGVARNRIARINSDGTLDATFDPGTAANDVVSSCELQSDGKVIITGYFTSIDGTGRNRIARLNSDGSLDLSYNPGTGANAAVWASAIQADNKVIIGGQFTNYNGTARNYIARINTDGTIDATFNPGTGASSNVRSLGLQVDEKVIVGGDFTTYNGTARARIARVNTDGTLDGTFDPGTGIISSYPTCFAVQDDGKILVGGGFTSYAGIPTYRIVRVTTNGTIDATFNTGTGASSLVSALALQSDGKVIIGGSFATYTGTGRNRIAKLNADGSLDTSFDPGTGVGNNSVTAISIQADGKVVIGGSFTSYDGVNKNHICRVHNSGELPLCGNYTIGGVTPDYTTINDAVADLENVGISCPVIFNIRDGVYNEQISIPGIAGSSSINTITFQSENLDSTLVEVTFSANAGDNYTWDLNGVSHITLNKIGITATNASFGSVVQIRNVNSNIAITNCEITGIVNANTDDHILISSPTTREDSIAIVNNRLVAGSKGINLMGQFGIEERGTVISGNYLLNQYSRGISLTDQKGSQIIENQVESNTSFGGYIGIILVDVHEDFNVDKNKVIKGTGFIAAGITIANCSATNLLKGYVTNNMIISNATSCLEVTNSNYVQVLHNSANNLSFNDFDKVIYSNTGSNCIIQNNILTGTNGAKIYDIQSGTFSLIENNILYTTGPTFGTYNFTDETNLFDWQTNAAPYDVVSQDINPNYTNENTDLLLSDLSPISIQSGADLTAIVPLDIEGESRTTTPWIGCDEYYPPPPFYWVGDAGNWNDPLHWSATSGGTGGLGVPATTDDVIFDSNSLSGSGIIVTMPDGTWTIKTISFQDVLKTPMIIGAGVMIITN